MLAERDWLLPIIIRGRRREERKPRVWVRQVYWENSISLTAVAVSLSWFSGLSRIGDMLKKRVLFS